MNELYNHQREGIEFLTQNNGGFLAYEMGLGKTRIVIEFYRRVRTPGLKLLVICPLSLIHTAWKDDLEKFAPELIMCDMHGKHRREADVYITNYEAFTSKKRYAEIVELVTMKKMMCCLDESSRISNPRAVTTKNILAIRSLFQVKICLSGTPCSQSETQWWSQVTFLRSGVLHDSFFGFRNNYFHLQRGKASMTPRGMSSAEYASMFQKGWKFAMTQQKRDALIQRLKPVVLWRKLDECIDMPDEVDEIREVEMTDEQALSYKMMKTQCVTEIKEKAIVAQTALTKLMKLRQITSGFAISPDGEAQRLPVNPKLNELTELLEDLGNAQAIIYVNFKAEVADIRSVLGDRCSVVDGETYDKADAVNRFKDGRCQYLVANLQSLSHGVTLVNARYCIYYSHSYSAEHFAQSRARIRRIGQNNTCVYIHIQCKGTIDKVIYDVLKRKGDAVDIVSEMLK